MKVTKWSFRRKYTLTEVLDTFTLADLVRLQTGSLQLLIGSSRGAKYFLPCDVLNLNAPRYWALERGTASYFVSTSWLYLVRLSDLEVDMRGVNDLLKRGAARGEQGDKARRWLLEILKNQQYEETQVAHWCQLRQDMVSNWQKSSRHLHHNIIAAWLEEPQSLHETMSTLRDSGDLDSALHILQGLKALAKAGQFLALLESRSKDGVTLKQQFITIIGQCNQKTQPKVFFGLVSLYQRTYHELPESMVDAGFKVYPKEHHQAQWLKLLSTAVNDKDAVGFASLVAADSLHSRVLVDGGADDNPLTIALRSAASQAMITDLIAQTHDLNLRDNHGQTPLMVACQRGNEQAVRALLKYKTVRQAINMTDKDGNTALHMSVAAGQQTIVSILLETTGLTPDERVDVSIRNNLGENVLHIAAKGESSPIMGGVLADRRATSAIINTLDCNGNTALSVACQREATQHVRQLLARGACSHTSNMEHRSPLDYVRDKPGFAELFHKQSEQVYGAAAGAGVPTGTVVVYDAPVGPSAEALTLRRLKLIVMSRLQEQLTSDTDYTVNCPIARKHIDAACNAIAASNSFLAIKQVLNVLHGQSLGWQVDVSGKTKMRSVLRSTTVEKLQRVGLLKDKELTGRAKIVSRLRSIFCREAELPEDGVAPKPTAPPLPKAV